MRETIGKILQRTLFVERYCFRSELVEGKEENIFNKLIMVVLIKCNVGFIYLSIWWKCCSFFFFPLNARGRLNAVCI